MVASKEDELLRLQMRLGEGSPHISDESLHVEPGERGEPLASLPPTTLGRRHDHGDTEHGEVITPPSFEVRRAGRACAISSDIARAGLPKPGLTSSTAASGPPTLGRPTETHM